MATRSDTYLVTNVIYDPEAGYEDIKEVETLLTSGNSNPIELTLCRVVLLEQLDDSIVYTHKKMITESRLENLHSFFETPANLPASKKAPVDIVKYPHSCGKTFIVTEDVIQSGNVKPRDDLDVAFPHARQRQILAMCFAVL